MTTVLFCIALGICGMASAEDAERALPVSLVALIANPDRYDGARVEVTAWGVLEFELAALFLAETDYTHLVSQNGVWLDVSEGMHPGGLKGYMTVVGTFHSDDKARRYAGRISDISQITQRRFRHPQQQADPVAP